MGHTTTTVVGWGCVVPMSVILAAFGKQEDFPNDQERMCACEWSCRTLKLYYETYNFSTDRDVFVTRELYSEETYGYNKFTDLADLLHEPSEAQQLTFGKQLARLLNISKPLQYYPFKFGCFSYTH